MGSGRIVTRGEWMTLTTIIYAMRDFLWGPVMLVLLVGTGVFLTFRLKFLPWRNLPHALKAVFQKEDGRKGRADGDITPFQSLMTALAATIGTGNIVGVATALVSGGPGALFWMWISALFGLSTKYAESVLAVKYREKNAAGEYAGGPMYAMKNGFRNQWLGSLLGFCFALFTVLASFGIGNITQANSIAGAMEDTFYVPSWVTGIALIVLTLIVLMGGIRSIGKVCEKLVPAMAVMYVLFALIVIICNFSNVPSGLADIFSMAFSVESVGGGVAGTVVMQAVKWGVARGVFSNEAGLGSAPIAAAAAKTDHPSRQGYINMTGTFFDTLIVCTITGLVIASSGMLGVLDGSGEPVTGVALTIAAFSTVLGKYGGYIITVGIALFAFSTILGWEYYGEKALEYLVKSPAACKCYRLIFCLISYLGATTALKMVWAFSDVMNGLMAIPNLICLIVLSREVAKECFDYQRKYIKRNGR